MLIVFLYQGKIRNIFSNPEWALASSVMFGQSIIKCIHIIGNYRGGFQPYNTGLAISLIILLGLIPSLTIFTLILIADTVPLWIIISQIIIFLITLIVFFLFNGLLISTKENN
jgi:hypothetical protein